MTKPQFLTETKFEIRWIDLTSGEVLNTQTQTVVALVEYEEDADGSTGRHSHQARSSNYTGSILEGDDLWFSAQCSSEDELLAEIERHLERE